MKNIRDILDSVINDIGLKKRFEKKEFVSMAKEYFERNFGEEITDIFIKKDIMFVCVRSSSLRMELQMKKMYLREKLNEQFGKDIVKDIKFIRGK